MSEVNFCGAEDSDGNKYYVEAEGIGIDLLTSIGDIVKPAKDHEKEPKKSDDASQDFHRMDAKEFDKEPKKSDAYRRMDAEVKDPGKASGRTKKTPGYRRMDAKEFKGMKSKAKPDFKGKTNEHVFSVKKVDAKSFIDKSSAKTWLRKNKWSAASTGIGVALDATSLVVSIIEDGGSFGPSTAIKLSEIAGEVVGTYSAVKIASLLGIALPSLAIPGLNIAVSLVGIIGFIGGLIGSLVAGGIAQFILALNPTAPGTGPPILDTDPQPFVYGAPDTGHKTDAKGTPSTGMNTNVSGAPSNGDEHWSDRPS